MNESQLNFIRDYLFTVIIQNNFPSVAQPLITFNNLFDSSQICQNISQIKITRHL